MTPGLAHALLLLSLPVLSGLGGTGLLLSNAQKQNARLAERVARLTRASAPPVIRDAAPVIRALPHIHASPLTRVLALFGCHHKRRAIYPVPWWAVLLTTLIIGRIGALICSSLLGDLAWLAWPVIWVMGSRAAFNHWANKHRDVMLKQFPDALAMIVRCARVGVPVPEAIRVVAREAAEPTRSEFGRLADEIAIGTALDTALRESATRTGLPEYRFFATALTLQAQAGGSLSESLEMLAEIIRKRVALKARGYALTSEGRTSTMVLCAMPFLIVAMLLVLNPPYIMVMFTTPSGCTMLTVGIIMLVLAVLVMRRMIQAALA
jgi:tight adherence protein B